MNVTAVLCALSLLIGGVALSSSPVQAAGWISGADSYAAPWVKDIEQELLKKEYRYVLGNDPRTPQASVLKLLNRAAAAYEAKNIEHAKELIEEALEVLTDGVRSHYYSHADVAPILKFIREHSPVQTS